MRQKTGIISPTLLLWCRRHRRDFAWTATINRLTGSDKVGLAIEGGRLAPLLEEWDHEAAQFLESRNPYLLYRKRR